MLVAFYAPMKSPHHPVPSGDRQMAQLLMEALGKGGHQVQLASQHRAYDGTGDKKIQAAIRQEGDRQAMGLIEAYGDGRITPPQIWFTYHVYHKAPDWLGPRISEALNIPYVIAEASYAAKQEGGPWNIGLEASKRAIVMSDAVLSFNDNDNPGIKPFLKNGTDITPFPPFVDTRPYARAAEDRTRYRAITAEQYNVDPGVPWLISVAMMRTGDKLRSYEILGQALERISNQSWHLLVVGDGEARDDVRMALHPVGARVRYIGAKDSGDLPGLYAASDLYVWPAVNEAFGMAFVEAQASGIPVIAGDSGGVSGVVNAPDCGVLVPPHDPEQMARAITGLLSQPDKMKAMGKQAQARTWEHHGLNGAARRLTAVFEQLVSSCPS